MTNRSFPLFLFVFALAGPAAASEADSAIKVTDLAKIRSLTNIQVKPGGGELAFSVRSVVVDTSKKTGYKYITEWWIKNLTIGLPARKIEEPFNFTQVLYSPDGRRWAIGRGDNKRSQLFSFPQDGSQPRQLTHLEQGVSGVRFSPNGKKVLLSVSLNLPALVSSKTFNPEGMLPGWSLEKPGIAGNRALQSFSATPDADGNAEEIEAYLARNAREEIAKVTDKLQFQTENSTTGELRFTHWYLMELGAVNNPIPLTKGFRSWTGADFLSNEKVLLSVETETGAHPDRVSSTDLLLLDLPSQKTVKILGDTIHRFQVAAVSPSGKLVAVSRSKYNSLTVGDLIVYNVNTWEGIPIPFDRSQSNVQFARNEKFIYFISPSNGGYIVNHANLKTKKVTTLTSVDEGISDYWVGDQRAVFVKTTFANPSELYLANEDFRNEKVITDFNSSWLAGKDIGKPEKSTFLNEQGFGIDYWVLKPKGYREGEKYPLIVEIHGGPTLMFGPGDATMWHEYQYFRSKGYGVLFSNPRGSGGYGEAFLKANFKDWGPGPARDVLGALSRTLAAGWVDSTKLFVTGGSYGAYLTTWILAHNHRFKAASSQRGVYDLHVFFGSANVWYMLKRYFDGLPWEDGIDEQLIRQSPTTYAQNIRTPLLIFHGENDYRTGPVQSDYLYKQLKVLERPVEYVRHPGADHEITRTGDVAQRIDQLLRTYEFFERYRSK